MTVNEDSIDQKKQFQDWAQGNCDERLFPTIFLTFYGLLLLVAALITGKTPVIKKKVLKVFITQC